MANIGLDVYAKKFTYVAVALMVFGFALTCGATRAAADDSGHGFEYCYTNYPDATGYMANQATYFTKVFGFYNGSAYGAVFEQYVEKKYSLRSSGPTGCSYGGSQAGVENSLKQRVAQLKAAGNTVVETEWTKDTHEALMAELKKNPPPPPPPVQAAPHSPAPPSAAQAAYEKAMEAQRPHSVTQAQLDAAKPGHPTAGGANSASSGPVQKYTYCITTGSPRGNNAGHTIYYYTGIFLPSPAINPQHDFLVMLQAAHPQEYIGSVSCMTAQPMEMMEKALANDEKGKRANHEVVETNWKPKT